MQLVNCNKASTLRACQQEQQEQQKHQALNSSDTQQKGKHCLRRLLPRASRVQLPGAYGSLTGDRRTQAGAEASSSGAERISFTLEDEELPTILANNVAKPKPRCQKRGYRIFYRPLLGSANYYSVPFPAPECLKLECDGDSTLWEDLEVRVISHQGVDVWQDLETRTEDILNDIRGSVYHGRKFGQKRVHNSAALLTIEATILHNLRSPAAEAAPLTAAPQEPESEPAQPRHNGDRRPIKLMQKLKQMKQTQLREFQLQPKQLQLLKQQQPPRVNPSVQQSLIPRLSSNWSTRPQQTQRMIASQQTSRKEEKRLRCKVLVNKHQIQRRSHKAGFQRVAGAERLTPSYMKPYSPVLHYPLPSKLPVATHTGVRRFPIRLVCNTGCSEPLKPCGTHPLKTAI